MAKKKTGAHNAKRRAEKKGRRALDSKLFAEEHIDHNFTEFIRDYILPHVALKGYKLPEKQSIAIQCIFNLFIAKTRKKVVADNRDNSKNYLRIKIWDALRDAGLCQIASLGSEMSGCVTRYRATGLLMAIIEQYSGPYWDYNLAKNTQREHPVSHALFNIRRGKVDLETGDKIPKPQQGQLAKLRDLPPIVLRQIEKMERRTEFRNQINLRHRWAYHFDDIYEGRRLELNPCDRVIHSGSFLRYEGMHSWGLHSIQSLNSKERREIVIDGEPAAELDFSGYVIRRCYNTKGLDPPHDKDIYRPKKIFPKFYKSPQATKHNKKIVRAFVKMATNVCFNTLSEREAVQAVSEKLRKHKEKKLLYKIIYQIERLPKPQIKEIIRRITHTHRDIEYCFFKKWLDEYTPVGSFYMTQGCFIMERILYELATDEIPAVGIHDAIVCRRSDVERVREKMVEVYACLCFGFEPVIKREY